ncbi:hypothetical protein D2A91_08415 [Enterococcus faecalis]|nr:hypothetical protein [Enterococcus faecalis]
MKTKLQIKREQANLTIEQLALKASKKVDCGSASHLELVIKSIETQRCLCPKPRKTYEWKALAKALKCGVSEIFEEEEK